MFTLKSGEPLFIFEMANNHMGSVEHGLRIIRAFHAVSQNLPFRFGFKLQYRHLDTFIHPDYHGRDDSKYVKRFSETRLDDQQMLALKTEMQTLGFVSICTPFDERSVDLIEAHEYDVIKIGSCSFTDWSLLERVVKADKPIIASTAGAALEEIDRVVNFFEHRGKDFALMHCTGEYPTADARLQLNQIDFLRQRYPQVRVGYSTHENPDNADSIKIAIAKGATIFEKHIGVPTDSIRLNAYSATPEQIGRWLESARQTFEMCGVAGTRPDFSQEEIATLRSLQRGVFARRAIAQGERIRGGDVFFAIPTTGNQVTANDFSKYTEFYAQADLPVNAPLLATNTRRHETREQVYKIVQRVKQFLRTSGVVVPPRVDLEISHHYGIDRFDEYGLTMLTVVNREYCKKLIVLLPGQRHPEQYHQVKEETFHVLYGDAWVDLNGAHRQCRAGEVIVVERGVRHSFGTERGVVIEEISSTHHGEDSFYTDPSIRQNESRKTLLTYWLE
ncbi:MAG: cupin domain-containing protein [Chloroflexi bacterium]|nr:cupin domain-containing protein [Chloroflexota bacterium]